MTKIKIGRIPYTNTWPVNHFFDFNKFIDEVEFIPQVPRQLNKQMADGLIDMGPISSFAYAENANKYLLLPNLSVSALGTVGSISLFLKGDLKDIINKRIALSNTSATSVNLLRIILEGFLGGKPEYIIMQPNINDMMDVADAALLIGDEALLAGWVNEVNQIYRVIDLGNEWFERTNHWMTFAVWAVRKEIVKNNPEILYRIYQEFITSKQKGYTQKDMIIQASINKYGGKYSFWKQYFNNLCHDFGIEQINGLKYYYYMAKEIGAIQFDPEIELINFDGYIDQSNKIKISK